jgi:hypothetical protein
LLIRLIASIRASITKDILLLASSNISIQKRVQFLLFQRFKYKKIGTNKQTKIIPIYQKHPHIK